MENSKPDKPSTEQQISDTDKNSHRKINNTDITKIISQEHKQQSKNYRHTTYERTNNRILAGILVVTFVYAVFSGLQWNIMRSSMELDQRAWMGVSNVSAIFEIGKPLNVIVEFKNTGKTPAKNMTSVIVLDPVEPNTPPDFAVEQTIERKTRGVITPQHFTHIHTTIDGKPLDDMSYKSIIAGNTRISVHGIVEYDDIFGYHHWLTYCYFFTPDMKNKYAYTEHNDTGDGKPYPPPN